MKILLTTLNSKFIHTNLAIRYLKSYTKDLVDADIREYTINNDLDYILKDIYKNDYDVILFSTYIWNVLDIVKLCENIKKVKTLNAYSEEYDATVEVGKDYMFILEKFSKLYNFSKELDDILTFISNTMQNKCPVNLSKLQEKNVTLSESMISMINAYNLSLEKELTSEGANI